MLKRLLYLAIIISIPLCFTSCMIVDGPCPADWYRCGPTDSGAVEFYNSDVSLEQSATESDCELCDENEVDPASTHICCPCWLAIEPCKFPGCEAYCFTE